MPFNAPNSHPVFDYFYTWLNRENNHEKGISKQCECMFSAQATCGSDNAPVECAHTGMLPSKGSRTSPDRRPVQ